MSVCVIISGPEEPVTAVPVVPAECYPAGVDNLHLLYNGAYAFDDDIYFEGDV